MRSRRSRSSGGAKLTPEQALYRTKRLEKLRAFLSAFKGARTNIVDASARGNRFVLKTPRAFPNESMWGVCEGVVKPRPLPYPHIRFCAVPKICKRTLGSSLGRTLQWLAMNPYQSLAEIARVCGRSPESVRNDVKKLHKLGILIKLQTWTIHPALIGEGRLFIHRSHKSMSEDEIYAKALEKVYKEQGLDQREVSERERADAAGVAWELVMRGWTPEEG